MIHLVRRVRAAGYREVALAARVWLFVALLGLPVRLCGVGRLLRFCTLRAPRPPEDEARIVACVDRVLARHPGMSRSPCLKRSLTLYRFLGGPATDLQLCLGVRYVEGPRPGGLTPRLQGHAWLLRHGAPFLESDHRHLRQFRVIYRYPARHPSPA